MRLWPLRRAPAPAPPVLPTDDWLVLRELLRRRAADVLAVRDEATRGPVVVFKGTLTREPAAALDLLLERYRPLGYTPFLQAEGSTAVLSAWPLAETTGRPRVRTNVLLFALTCVSTLLAGWFFSGSPTFDAIREAGMPLTLLTGVPFAATLLVILGVHEFGHYVTARRYGAQVSLPYFIPAPPPLFLFGTLGALIRMRSPARDRNALFDIAAAGPLAGLAVALPATLVGLAWSHLAPASEHAIQFGHSLLMRALVDLRFGTVPDGMMVFTHPVADAAWAGFFVTALNLFPVGQLDGGRIAYALFGRHHLLVGRLTVIGMIVLGTVTGAWNWYVWAALVVLLIGFGHQPPLDDLTPLSPGRRVVGAVCLLLFVLLLPPIPIS